MDQNIKAKNLLLYVFLSVYALTALGTLSMLFFGVGDVRDGERSILINTFLVESAVAVAALFYSVWNIKSKEQDAMEHTRELIVNPLEESFKDLVIPVESLRLPTVQLHENKHFKRCKFIGPASIAIIGGNYINDGFLECGDIVALPNDVYLTGMIVLKNCTVENCEFIRTTIFTDQGTAKGFLKVPGVSVKGILS
jgi:hypothetical protein